MEIFILTKTLELKRAKDEIGKKLNIKINIMGRKVTIDGEPYNEYLASLVLDAIDFGFSAEKALLLKDPDVLFRRIPVKEFTRRKNIYDVRARIIGTHGQTLNTLKEISGCHTILNGNMVGVIGSAESIDNVTIALTNLIRGSKQSNVYRYLEKQNKNKKLYAQEK